MRIERFDLRAQPLSAETVQKCVLEALRNWVFTSVTPSKLIGLTKLGQDAATQTLSCAKLVAYCWTRRMLK